MNGPIEAPIKKDQVLAKLNIFYDVMKKLVNMIYFLKIM